MLDKNFTNGRLANHVPDFCGCRRQLLLVQRRALHLPPALTLSAQVVQGFLAGFIGLLFATPLVAAGLILVRMIYVEGILGNRESGEPAPFEQR